MRVDALCDNLRSVAEKEASGGFHASRKSMPRSFSGSEAATEVSSSLGRTM